MKLAAVVAFGAMAMAQEPPPVALRNAASSTSEIAPGSMVEIAPSLSVTEVRLNDRPVQIVPPPRGGFARAVIPPDASPGEARVVVFEGETRHEITVTLRPHAPGLFAANNAGAGPALAANSLTRPALPGQLVTLWGTGLGEVRDVFVNLAGRVVRAQYAGHHPDFPGLDQINFYVPSDTWIGCYVPVSVRVGDAESNRVTLAVSDSAGACPHPLGLSYTDLVTLDAGGTILAGSGSLSFTDGQSAFSALRFLQVNAAAVYGIAGPQQPDSEFLGCSVSLLAGGIGGPGPRTADAGAVLTFTAPDGSRYDSGDWGSPYQWPNGIPLLAGQWLLSAPGGTTVGAFQQVLRVPPPLRDFPLLTRLDRDTDLTLAWNPSGYASGDLLRITIGGGRGGVVSCLTYTWMGRLTIAAELLARLTAGEGFVSARITPHPAYRTRFDVPRVGSGTVPVMLNYGISTTTFVEIR